MNVREMFGEGRFKEIVERYAYSVDSLDEESRRYVWYSIDIVSNATKEFGGLQEKYIQYQQSGNMDDASYLQLLEDLSSNAFVLDEQDLCITYLKEIYEFYNSRFSEDDPQTLSALNRLKRESIRLQRYSRDLNVLKEYYSTQKSLYGIGDLTCEVLERIIDIYSDKEDTIHCREYNNYLYEDALIAYGFDSERALKALYQAAAYSYDLGEYERALLEAQQCFSMQKKKFTLHHDDTLRTYYLIASLYYKLEKYQESYKAACQSLPIREEVSGVYDKETAKVKELLANLYEQFEEYEKALELYKDIQLCYKLKNDRLGLIHVLSSMRGLYYKLHDEENIRKLDLEIYELYLRLYDSYLALYERGVSNEKDRTTLLEELIFSSSRVGKYNDFFKYSEQYFKGIYQNNREITARTLDVLYEMGNVHNRLNHIEESFNAYVKCFNERNKLLGENHPDTLKALNKVIETCMDQETKLYYARLNAEIHKKYDDEQLLESLYLLVKLENNDKFVQLHDQISFLLQSRSPIERVRGYWELILALRYRGATHNTEFFKLKMKDIDFYLSAICESFIDDILNGQTPWMMNDLFIESYYEQIVIALQLGYDVYDMLIKIKTFLLNLERCYSSIKKDEAYQAVSKEYKLYKEKMVHSHGTQEKGLQRKLQRLEEKRKELLLPHLTILEKDIHYKDLQEVLQEGEYLFDLYCVDDNITAILLKNNDMDIQIFRSNQLESVLKQNQILWESMKHLYICPDGDLYNISFARYINTEISYLSSPQDLLEDYDDSSDDDLDIVSVIYPDYYDESSESRGRKGVLFGSYIEGMYINQLFEDSTLLSREDANHDNFLDIISPKILHISTHGEYVKSFKLMENGRLCLSGYNKTDSGYVTAAEIQDMDLTDTELVVLSACQTGQGKSIGGRGVYGIRRAFELAGAKTLLLTVEEIDDYNAALFMKIFYQYYKKSRNAMQSYQETQLYLSDYQNGIKELIQFKEDFKNYLKEEIHPTTLKMKLIGIDNRIKECMAQKKMLKTVHGHYEEEDWKGFIIQGKVHI